MRLALPANYLEQARVRTHIHGAWAKHTATPPTGHTDDLSPLDLDVTLHVVEDMSQDVLLHSVIEGDMFAQLLMHLIPRTTDSRTKEAAHRAEMFVQPTLAAVPPAEHRFTCGKVLDARILHVLAVSFLARRQTRPNSRPFNNPLSMSLRIT